jgi:hypothetical protein
MELHYLGLINNRFRLVPHRDARCGYGRRSDGKAECKSDEDEASGSIQSCVTEPKSRSPSLGDMNAGEEREICGTTRRTLDEGIG